MSDSEIQAILKRLQAEGPPLPAATRAALAKSLAQYKGELGADMIDKTVAKLLDGLKSIAKPGLEDRGGAQPVEVGQNPASLVGRLNDLLKRFDSSGALAETMNLPFKIDVATRVTNGAGRFITDQTDVDEYPAWELHRIYDRDVPRGFMRGPKGVLVEVPDDDWPARFADACTAAGDDEALRVFNETGRMIALKSSGVWDELGNNRDDCLGNPFPPFAFNSGYGVDGVPRLECIELGLLATDEKPEGSKFDFSKLFSLPEAA